MADAEGSDGEGSDGEYESDDTWESDLESEAEIAEIMQLDIAEDTSNTGKKEYLAKCAELKIVPVAMFIAKLDCEHINLRHHGMGVNGARAIAAALQVNTQIRSLNLGDNWFEDRGTGWLAEVLSTNTSLTSINLADNRIGLPGVKALCTRLQENGTLAELGLKGNNLNDQSAAMLAEALKASASLTKVDLSYNAFGEAAGVCFGDMLNGHSHLLDVNLKWNKLKAKGGAAVAEGLKANQVLNKIDMGWNGLGDVGIAAVSEMIQTNVALTHLDISHNRIHQEGCMKLAEGIKQNNNLLSLELGFNPMGVQEKMDQPVTLWPEQKQDGISALIDALRTSDTIEAVGLSNVQAGGAYARGSSSRFDPKNPDGHYALDLKQPWDRFIAETLHERMLTETGESWINVVMSETLYEKKRDAASGKEVEPTVWVPAQLGMRSAEFAVPTEGWQIPQYPLLVADESGAPLEDDLGHKTVLEGTLEFDYVTWKRGLEASFNLELSNPCDLYLGEKLLQRTQAAEGSGEEGAHEELRECRLNDEPIDPGTALPNTGMLKVVYFSTIQQDTISFAISVDLGSPSDRLLAKGLWERAITTPTDSWANATLGGSPVSYEHWQYPKLPEEGTLELTYAVRLAIKPSDRGIFFSPPMAKPAFEKLAQVLKTDGLSDFDKNYLIKQAAERNYFTCHQVNSLIRVMSALESTSANRRGVAITLYKRTTDSANFAKVALSEDVMKEADREMVMDEVNAKGKRKPKK